MTDPNSLNSSDSSAALEARVREARGKSKTRLTITDDGCAIFGPNDTALDAYAAAIRAQALAEAIAEVEGVIPIADSVGGTKQRCLAALRALRGSE